MLRHLPEVNSALRKEFFCEDCARFSGKASSAGLRYNALALSSINKRSGRPRKPIKSSSASATGVRCKVFLTP
jgi:hypothetical protein